MKILLLLMVSALSLGGCVTMDESYAVPALHRQASFDLNCPQDQLQISQAAQDQYSVEGCHRRASYQLESCDAASHECTFRSVVAGASPVIPALNRQASFDLDCPQAQLQVSQIDEHKYGVAGCNRRASYQVESCDAGGTQCRFTQLSSSRD